MIGRHDAQVGQQADHVGDVRADIPHHVRIVQAVGRPLFLDQIQKSFHRDHRVADMLAQAGGDEAKTADAVGDHPLAQQRAALL